MIPSNINGFYAELIVDALVRRGANILCVSPGSRSAPLTLAAAEHPDTDIRIIHDERASAYFAVGFARACGRPAAVITTSGTAVANLFPAVVEAYQSRLPLALLTADRPEELQQCGANQTIDQEHIFGDYTAESVTLPVPDCDSDPYTTLDAIAFALDTGGTLPVQINCRFREPLAPSDEPYDFKWLCRRVDKWYLDHPYSAASDEKTDVDSEIETVAQIINEASRCLIVAGPEISWRISRHAMALARRLGAPVCADVLSNYRGDDQRHVVHGYDLSLDSNAAAKLNPDVVIHVGGLPTSRRLQEFIKYSGCREYIKFQEHDRTVDPDRFETRRIIAPINISLAALLPLLEKRNDARYLEKWRHIERICLDELNTYFENGELTEASLMHTLGDLLSDEDALFLGNSMPVRDADTFLGSISGGTIVGCNRGVSGIDGTVASACGFACGGGHPTTLVLGDIALLHDLNSLAVAARSEAQVIIVVVNNNGGGIFHFLPIAQYERHFETCFGTPHGLRFDQAARMFGLPYYCPSSISEFRDRFRSIRDNHESAILEIVSDRRKNKREHDYLRNRIHQLLDTKG